MRNKFIIIILVITFAFSMSKTSFAKDYKLYVCNFFVSFNLAKDNCSGTNSFYKIYFDNKSGDFKSRDECLKKMDKTINSQMMSKMFPEGDGLDAGSWIFDCDNLWKF